MFAYRNERIQPVGLTSLSHNWLILHIEMDQIYIQIQVHPAGMGVRTSISFYYVLSKKKIFSFHLKRRFYPQLQTFQVAEAAMCVDLWLQKFDIRILKSVTCIGFSNPEEFYQG